MLGIAQSESFAEDLDKILIDLSIRNPAAADRLVESLHSKAELLSQFPMIGRARDDLSPGLRSVVVDDHVLYYRVTETGLVMSRILHHKRDEARIAWNSDEDS